MGAVADRVGLFELFTKLGVAAQNGGRTALLSNHVTDQQRLTAGVNYFAEEVHQTGLRVSGFGAGRKLSPIVEMRLDFYHRLANPWTGEEAVRDGPYQADCDLYGSREYWRRADNIFINGGARDVTSAPVITLERDGDVVHWQIVIGLELEEA